jgi:ParB family chromosome partitioning protein
MEQAVRSVAAPPAEPVLSEAAAPAGATPIDGAGLTPATQLRPPGLLELEELLADRLDTRVAVAMGAKRGRVTIDFADLEDLERIYRLMTSSSQS